MKITKKFDKFYEQAKTDLKSYREARMNKLKEGQHYFQKKKDFWYKHTKVKYKPEVSIQGKMDIERRM